MRFATLLFFLFCTLSNCSAVEELLLPRPTGTYSIGTKAIQFYDPSRFMLRGNEKKRWMVQAYYPSEPHQDPYPYMPGTIKEGNVQGTKDHRY